MTLQQSQDQQNQTKKKKNHHHATDSFSSQTSVHRIIPNSLIAGYVAGICGTMIGHPFDSLKVLLQTRWSQKKNIYPIPSTSHVITTPLPTFVPATGATSSSSSSSSVVTVTKSPTISPLLFRLSMNSKQSHSSSSSSLVLSSPLHTSSLSLRSLYAGIWGPLLTVGLIQCINFSIYDTCRQYFFYSSSSSLYEYHYCPEEKGQDTNPSSLLQTRNYLYHDSIWNVGISSFISGGIVSIITSPLAIIKTKQQIMSWTFKQAWKDTTTLHHHHHPSRTTAVTNYYYNNNNKIMGILMYAKVYPIHSFFIGFTPHFICESLGRSVYLMTYESLKRSCIEWNYNTRSIQSLGEYNSTSTTTTSLLSSTPYYISLSQRMICAALSGIASWSFIFPLDVIRSRIYYESISGTTPTTTTSMNTKSTWTMIQQMYYENGKSISIFFRGYGVTILRAGPVAAVVLPVYDYTLDWLNHH